MVGIVATKNDAASQFYRKALLLFCLWLVVMSSGLGVIYTTHVSRQLFNDLEGLRRQTAMLHTEWGQYLLEQSAWAGYNRVEEVAGSKLSMVLPEQDKIIVIKKSQ